MVDTITFLTAVSMNGGEPYQQGLKRVGRFTHSSRCSIIAMCSSANVLYSGRHTSSTAASKTIRRYLSYLPKSEFKSTSRNKYLDRHMRLSVECHSLRVSFSVDTGVQVILKLHSHLHNVRRYGSALIGAVTNSHPKV